MHVREFVYMYIIFTFVAKLGQSTFVDSHQSSSSTPSITSTPIKKYAEGTNLRDRKLQQYSSTFDENAEKENKPPEKTSGR